MREPSRSHRRAKEFRERLSLPEVLLWRRLKRSAGPGPQFRRQHPVGRYVLDFYCAAARLCIEIDSRGHGAGDQPAHDIARDRRLELEGIRVERIAASEVLKDPDAVAVWARALAEDLMLTRRA